MFEGLVLSGLMLTFACVKWILLKVFLIRCSLACSVTSDGLTIVSEIFDTVINIIVCKY